jgi:hypothetical protein
MKIGEGFFVQKRRLPARPRSGTRRESESKEMLASTLPSAEEAGCRRQQPRRSESKEMLASTLPSAEEENYLR